MPPKSEDIYQPGFYASLMPSFPEIKLTMSEKDIKKISEIDNIPYHKLYTNSTYMNMKAITVKKIIYNDPATVVFWEDGTKTVVKRSKGEKNNHYTAFCAALAKKIYKNNSKVNKIVQSGEDQEAKKGRKSKCKNK